jgi:hypothetical protein
LENLSRSILGEARVEPERPTRGVAFARGPEGRIKAR